MADDWRFDETARVLVVGDVMLDRYHEGDVSRISPEAPVPIVRVRSTFERPGGAANVAFNIAALGLPVTLIGYVGADPDADALRASLVGSGVDCDFVMVENARTIVKLRALSMKQQVIRLDFEDDFSDTDHARLHDRVEAHLGSHALVVLSDYAKGTLAAVAEIIAGCKRRALPVLVDPKGTDFARYAGATVLTPNFSEFTAVAGRSADEADFITRAVALRTALTVTAVLITRGERGMTLVDDDGARTTPARAIEVYDVTGAGDTVIATLAASMASGRSIAEGVALANRAAGIVVARKGTSSVSASELFVAADHAAQGGSTLALVQDIHAAKRRGDTIVMTNGCFDIIHSGHVEYLRQARSLGDRLVVAVNSDASVGRLKGSARPVNTLSNRLAVLSALRCVDWVIPFDGSRANDGAWVDTPHDLIVDVAPDILVKGGDYAVQDIVGAGTVLARGGDVRVLPFVEGQSTTAILERALAGGQGSS